MKKYREEEEIFKRKAMRAFAKSNKIIILAFIKNTYSREIEAISVQERIDFKGKPYYTFGRLYHVFGERCVYDQCGCSSFEDEKEVRLAAYKFFGIK